MIYLTKANSVTSLNLTLRRELKLQLLCRIPSIIIGGAHKSHQLVPLGESGLR